MNTYPLTEGRFEPGRGVWGGKNRLVIAMPRQGYIRMPEYMNKDATDSGEASGYGFKLGGWMEAE